MMRGNRWIWATLTLAGMLSLATGCGSEKKDDWYEYSSAVDQRKDTYMRQQMEYGVSEEDAAALWRRERSIDQTRGVTHSTVGVEESGAE